MVEYVTNGIIDFLDRQPAQLSPIAADDLDQMAILHQFVSKHDMELQHVEVAAIKMKGGRFELLCLDTPELPGMLPERIAFLDKAQLEACLETLLPGMKRHERLSRALAGAVIVDHERWVQAKKSVSP